MGEIIKFDHLYNIFNFYFNVMQQYKLTKTHMNVGLGTDINLVYLYFINGKNSNMGPFKSCFNQLKVLKLNPTNKPYLYMIYIFEEIIWTNSCTCLHLRLPRIIKFP